jgi:hypothetical protein
MKASRFLFELVSSSNVLLVVLDDDLIDGREGSLLRASDGKTDPEDRACRVGGLEPTDPEAASDARRTPSSSLRSSILSCAYHVRMAKSRVTSRCRACELARLCFSLAFAERRAQPPLALRGR